MRGHVRRRVWVTKSGRRRVRFYVVVELPRGLDGERRQKWHGGFEAKAEAERACARLVTGVLDGTYAETTNTTMGEWLTESWVPAMRQRVKPTTAAAYLSLIRHHVLPTIGHRRLTDLTAADLDAQLLHRGRLAIQETRTRVGTEIVVTTHKAGVGRTIDLDPRTTGHLASLAKRRRPGVDDYVVLAPDGEPVRPDQLSERFLTLSGRLDLPRLRFHDLRHTHATIALQAGVPVRVVAERLGHANPAMTLQVYAHVLPGMQSEAAALIADIVTGPQSEPDGGILPTNPVHWLFQGALKQGP